MATTLAKTTFAAGPLDSVATVDVYTQRSNSVINNRPDTLANSGLSLASSLFGGKGMLASLPLGGGVSGLLNDVTKNLTSQLGITNPKLAKAVNALTPIVTKEIEKKLPTAKINTMIATAGGIERAINMVSNGNVSGVVSSVNSIAQTAGVPGITIKDPKGLIALSTGLVDQGVKNGVPGVLTTLKSSNIITSNAQMNAVVKGVLPSIIQKGDLGTLKEITTVAPSSLSTLDDKALNEFAKYYPAPDSPKSIAQYQSDFGDTKSTFAAIKPDWLSAPRTASNGTTDDALNLGTLNSASSEFKKMVSIGALTSGNPDDKWLLAATATPVPEYTAEQKAAWDGITITAGETKFTPFNQEESEAKYAAYLKQYPTPEARAAMLYPAANGKTSVSQPPVDPRALAEVERLKTVQSGQKAPVTTVRAPGFIQGDMDRTMDQWTAELKTSYEPERALIAAYTQQYGKDSVQVRAQTAKAESIKVAIDDKWKRIYDAYSTEFTAAVAVYDQTTIT